MQEVIKNYRVQKRIGKGATGGVYAAQDEDNKFYALKIQHKVSESEKAMNNQIKEIKFQNVINTYEQFEYKKDIFSYFCVVMDYCNAGDLYQYLNNCRFMFNFEQKKYMLFQIAFGIWEIHQLNIIHRDIKPSNILVSCSDNGDFYFKICDLGLSKIQENQNTVNIGTPLYMAPELIDPDKDKAEYDKSVDVWAFGALIYDFYSTQQLFFGLTVPQIFKQIKLGYCLQQKLMIITDPPLFEIAQCCLSYIPNNRPTIEQILIQLNQPLFYQQQKQFKEQNQKIFSPNQDKVSPQVQDKQDVKQPQNQQYQAEIQDKCQQKIEDQPKQTIQDQPKQLIQDQQKYVIQDQPKQIIQDKYENKIQNQPQQIMQNQQQQIIQNQPQYIMQNQPSQIIQNQPSQIIQNQQSQIKSSSHIKNKVRLRSLLIDQTLIEQLCTMIEKGCQQDQVVKLMDEAIIQKLECQMNQIKQMNQ